MGEPDPARSRSVKSSADARPPRLRWGPGRGAPADLRSRGRMIPASPDRRSVWLRAGLKGGPLAPKLFSVHEEGPGGRSTTLGCRDSPLAFSLPRVPDGPAPRWTPTALRPRTPSPHSRDGPAPAAPCRPPPVRAVPLPRPQPALRDPSPPPLRLPREVGVGLGVGVGARPVDNCPSKRLLAEVEREDRSFKQAKPKPTSTVLASLILTSLKSSKSLGAFKSLQVCSCQKKETHQLLLNCKR